jgi:hypothetical protein
VRFSELLMINLLNMNPISKPGMRKRIGKNTGPSKIPKIFKRGDNISPTVIKKALHTKGRNDHFSISGIEYRYASQSENI